MRRTLWVAGLVAGLAGVASAQAHGRDRITLEEIQTLPAARNALEVVQSLRPHFLIARPSGSLRNPTPASIKVYVDGVPRGTTSALTQIPATLLVEIHYLRGPDATTRFGINHESGAILVKTSSQAPPATPPEG